jgi:DNA-binding response OmpR family regulator
VIAGYASLESAMLAMSLGAHDYLKKPFKLGEIDTIVGRIGEGSASPPANRADCGVAVGEPTLNCTFEIPNSVVRSVAEELTSTICRRSCITLS